MKKLLHTASLAVVILLGACSKSDDTLSPDGKGNSFPANYDPGVLIFKAGTQGIKRFDLTSGLVSDITPDWPNSSGWDISWDGSKGVKEIDPTGFETTTHYVIFDTQNGSTIKDVRYDAPSGYDGSLPIFSPDGSKLAITPTLNDGLIILDMNGNILHNIIGYGAGHEFVFLEPICWEVGGTILFKKDGALWRTIPDFSRALKIRDIPFDDWTGSCSASPDGTKIALSAGNHIWLMNTDGSDFHVVTESIQQEVSPCFSPDSKYIALKANSRAPMPGDAAQSAFHLCIIPADGQLYKVYPGEDDRVIHPNERGESNKAGLGKAMVWDFLWR